MTEKELDALIDNAPEAKVRMCLKYIVTEWFVEENYPLMNVAERVRTVNFEKEINSDTLEAVTLILHTFGFSPKTIEEENNPTEDIPTPVSKKSMT